MIEAAAALFTGISLLVRIWFISICSIKLNPTALSILVNTKYWCPKGINLVIYYTFFQSCHMDDRLYNTNGCYSSDIYQVPPLKLKTLLQERNSYFNNMSINTMQSLFSNELFAYSVCICFKCVCVCMLLYSDSYWFSGYGHFSLLWTAQWQLFLWLIHLFGWKTCIITLAWIYLTMCLCVFGK